MTFAERHMAEVADRWSVALESYRDNEPLQQAVDHLVDAFFSRAPETRCPLTERFIASLAIERALSVNPTELPTKPKTQAA